MWCTCRRIVFDISSFKKLQTNFPVKIEVQLKTMSILFQSSWLNKYNNLAMNKVLFLTVLDKRTQSTFVDKRTTFMVFHWISLQKQKDFLNDKWIKCSNFSIFDENQHPLHCKMQHSVWPNFKTSSPINSCATYAHMKAVAILSLHKVAISTALPPTLGLPSVCCF